MNNKNIFYLALTSLMIALCYVSFTFLKITIPTPLGFTSFHLGNTFCLLASLLLGPIPGAIAGAIGMGIGDLMDPLYVAIAPKTIILKTMIGLVTGTVAHKVLKISTIDYNKRLKAALISTSIGMLCNIIGEPTFGYFYYKYILQAPDKALKALTSFNLLSTSVNAVLAITISSLLYVAVYKRFKNKDLHL